MRSNEGETFALVGESGSGKSTTGRCMLRLIEPTSGEVLFRGENVLGVLERADAGGPARHADGVSGSVLVAQSAHARVRRSSKSRWSFTASGRRPSGAIASPSCFELVGLDPAHLDRYPHEFSGGQRQRIGVARALALKPSFIIADEPVSALDVSIQAQVINLLMDLQDQLKLTYLFIAHDLRLVRHISSRDRRHVPGPDCRNGRHRGDFRQRATCVYSGVVVGRAGRPIPTRLRARIELDPSLVNRDAPLRRISESHFAAVG